MNTIEGGLLRKFGNLPPYELEWGSKGSWVVT